MSKPRERMHAAASVIQIRRMPVRGFAAGENGTPKCVLKPARVKIASCNCGTYHILGREAHFYYVFELWYVPHFRKYGCWLPPNSLFAPRTLPVLVQGNHCFGTGVLGDFFWLVRRAEKLCFSVSLS